MESSLTESFTRDRKQSIVLALCSHLSLDPNAFLGKVDNDVTRLCRTVLEPSQNNSNPGIDKELSKWIEFADEFPVDSGACVNDLIKLNDELVQKSVLLGNGLKPSAADVIVFATVHSALFGLSNSDRLKLPHVTRWMDYIQSTEDFGKLFKVNLLEKVQFDPPALKAVKKVEMDSNVNKGVKDSKVTGTDMDKKKSIDVKKAAGENKSSSEKKRLPEKVLDEKDKETNVTLLKIQVGFVLKAWKHPSADSLLVEEIDVGEAKCRQVVSGLAKYLSPDDLTNQRVVLITNVKPGKLRDIMSEGLVLCASNEDHSLVEPLIAPEGAKIGECVSFFGYEGKPEDVLNPKRKQLEKVTPHFFTDDKGVATFKGIPFMTSGGPCTSSITKGSVK